MLTKSQNHNPNYLAKVVKLSTPITHPNADKLLGWIIDGNRVWTDNINYKEGDIVVYFPLECQINPLILSELNLYSKSDMNVDKTQKGFFDKNGRVRAIKLRGEPSEGFILKYEHFDTVFAKESDKTVLINFIESIGKEFDTLNDIWICKKYIPTINIQSQRQSCKTKNILLDGQFKFHYDTENFKKNVDKIHPNDLITITKKYHGTSGVSAKVLVKKEYHKIVNFFNNLFNVGDCFLTLWMILCLSLSNFIPNYLNPFWIVYSSHLGLIFFNKKYKTFMSQKIGYLSDKEYKDICSSRRVIKQIGEENKSEGGFYKFDIWKHCHNILKPKLENGITLYYEIVGYLPDGKMIQKNYNYNCVKPTLSTEFDNNNNLRYYEEKKEFRILVYRITYTTPEGNVIEFSWEQIKRYCERHGLEIPKTYFQGSVKEYVEEAHNGQPDMSILLERLQYEYLEKDDDECAEGIPDEGIVIRIENGKPQAYKLKSFAFLEKESKALDSNEVDLESEQSYDEGSIA